MNIKKPLYIQQPPFRYCGQCQIKVITEFFSNQHDNIISRERERSKHFLDYSPNIWSKRTGFMRPSTLFKTIKSTGLDVTPIDQSDFLSFMKNELDHHKLILMSIGHGYIYNKKKFSIVNALLWQHYISIWWYDDHGLYVYDSSVWEDSDIDYAVGNLYISWEIFFQSYTFALSKIILSIWPAIATWTTSYVV